MSFLGALRRGLYSFPVRFPAWGRSSAYKVDGFPGSFGTVDRGLSSTPSSFSSVLKKPSSFDLLRMRGTGTADASVRKKILALVETVNPYEEAFNANNYAGVAYAAMAAGDEKTLCFLEGMMLDLEEKNGISKGEKKCFQRNLVRMCSDVFALKSAFACGWLCRLCDELDMDIAVQRSFFKNDAVWLVDVSSVKPLRYVFSLYLNRVFSTAKEALMLGSKGICMKALEIIKEECPEKYMVFLCQNICQSHDADIFMCVYNSLSESEKEDLPWGEILFHAASMGFLSDVLKVCPHDANIQRVFKKELQTGRCVDFDAYWSVIKDKGLPLDPYFASDLVKQAFVGASDEILSQVSSAMPDVLENMREDPVSYMWCSSSCYERVEFLLKPHFFEQLHIIQKLIEQALCKKNFSLVQDICEKHPLYRGRFAELFKGRSLLRFLGSQNMEEALKLLELVKKYMPSSYIEPSFLTDVKNPCVIKETVKLFGPKDLDLSLFDTKEIPSDMLWLLCFFSDVKSAKKYIDSFYANEANKNKNISLPFIETLNFPSDKSVRDAFSKIVFESGSDVLKYVQHAEKIYTYLGNKHPKQYTDVVQAMAHILYAPQEPFEALARISVVENIDRAVFDHMVSCLEEARKEGYRNQLPSVFASSTDASGKTFYFMKLPEGDWRGPILGSDKFSSCCQSFGSMGEDVARKGTSDPRAGFYVVYRMVGDTPNIEKDVFVSQSMAYMVPSTIDPECEDLVFDSFEVPERLRKDPLLLKTVANLYLDASQQVLGHVSSCNGKPVVRVVVGASGGSRSVLEHMPHGSVFPLSEGIGVKALVLPGLEYSDARTEQWRLSLKTR